MSSNDPIAEPLAHENPYTPADIISLLQQNHWLTTDPTPEQHPWADRAAHLLGPAPLTSERFKEVITHLKESCNIRSRDLFHPIRLALTGQVGEGKLDRVILLVDEASTLPFATPVKSTSTRILEFCAALD